MFSFSGESLRTRLLYLITLVLSLTVHEWAHAYSAFRLGDDTAAREGRLTLSPLSHIDPIGSILCPLMGIPFGWAKPVPVNLARIRRDVSMSAGMIITAAAGPLSNLVLAIVCAIVYGLLLRFSITQNAPYALAFTLIKVNIALFLFNFIPVPPLDGSRVADGVMPYRLRPEWEQLQKYSWVLLLAVIYFAGPLMSVPIDWCKAHLDHLSALVAGRG
jgi:Zn-dependent protease